MTVNTTHGYQKKILWISNKWLKVALMIIMTFRLKSENNKNNKNDKKSKSGKKRSENKRSKKPTSMTTMCLLI